MSTGRDIRMQALHRRARALAYLADGHTTATHHIARHLGFDLTSGSRATARARNVLKWLEHNGLVNGVRAPSGGNVFWYRITDAGREFLKTVKL